ncbi:MAG: PfkB family carbohydrate kinase [Nanoarchaeota archaeon]
MKKIFDVYGVGDIVLDIILETNDEELRRLGISKNTNEIINLEKRDKILQNLNSARENTRIQGYAYNILNVLSHLGLKTNMATKIGMDEFGLRVQKELAQTKVGLDLSTGFGCTDSALTFITPDYNQTRKRHVGISTNISYKDVNVIKIKQSNNMLLDGNLLNSRNRIRIAKYASRIAKESDSKIIFDINNTDNVIKNKTAFLEIIELADVIICSLENAFLLLEEGNVDKIVKKLGEDRDAIIIKRKKDYLLNSKDGLTTISKMPSQSKHFEEYFTAGFTFGYNQGYSKDKACIIGSYLSGNDFIDENILDELNEIFSKKRN